MENKKLIKAIKKMAIKQFENDLKKSIIKELYNGSSKKQIKKLRKQILQEMQEELFGVLDTYKTSDKEENFIHTNTVDENELSRTSEVTGESKEQELQSTHEPGRIFEYNGFKFDVDKMSSIVTGRMIEKTNTGKAVERVNDSGKKDILGDISKLKNPDSDFSQKLKEIKKGSDKDLKSELEKLMSTPAPEMNLSDIKYTQGFNIQPATSLNSMNTVPSSRNFIKTDIGKLTPARREEISFFIGKLKKGIDSLEKGEKNIFYRRKKDNIYTFSYEKVKYDKNDFSFKFNLDLNMDTYGATINIFEFNIDGFNFDKGFVEILDIIKVLDASGFSLMKYIDEINEINNAAADKKESIKANLINNVETIRANAKLAEFIFDDRILRVLQSNDINTYGQLQKIEDLTSLKGVGTKTAEKIKEYTKN